MLPTPTTTHVPTTHIYPPSEDSYLLLDTLSSSPLLSLFRTAFPPPSPAPLILELGTGSGIVLAFLTAHAGHIFGREDVLALGVDVNAHACRATGETVGVACAERGGAATGTFLGCCTGDLTAPIRGGEVDVLVFNPPYVPTEDVPVVQPGDGEGEVGGGGEEAWERESRLLALSYAGGRDGMEVTDRMLGEVPRVLSARGVALVVLCAQNGPVGVMEGVRGWEGGGRWEAEVVGRSGKVGGWEKLVIVKIWRVGGPE